MSLLELFRVFALSNEVHVLPRLIPISLTVLPRD